MKGNRDIAELLLHLPKFMKYCCDKSHNSSLRCDII